jgi:UDPglucose 6-dehydrogenase
MRVAVIGSGYVGLVGAVCFAELGHEVVCVDNDEAKLAALRQGRMPIHEMYLAELLGKHRGHRLTFSSQLPQATRAASVIFIAVGTPTTETGEADLSYVESVSREIAHAIDGYKVIVEKSTVPVYTNTWIRNVISQSNPGADFDVVSNPEFLREGSAVTDFLYPDRIVVGADSARAAAVLLEVYEPLVSGRYYEAANTIPRPEGHTIPARLIQTSTKSAELIKHASNAFLALKISFINAVANVCEGVGADIEEVSHGVGTDSRIGLGFLRAGIGYGGSCFPKDLAAFNSIAREAGCDFPLLEGAVRINEEQKARFVRKVRSTLWTLKGKKLGVLGLAFKGGTDDIRESTAIAVIQLLLKEGCQITAYDPAAVATAKQVLGDQISYVSDSYEAATGADAMLILTDWEEFKTLDLDRLRAALKLPNVLDGRNLYDPAQMASHGLNYVSIGRATVPAGRSARSQVGVDQ